MVLSHPVCGTLSQPWETDTNDVGTVKKKKSVNHRRFWTLSSIPLVCSFIRLSPPWLNLFPPRHFIHLDAIVNEIVFAFIYFASGN